MNVFTNIEIIFEKQYLLLAVMLTNCSQLKELETVQVLDGKRISFSTPDSIPISYVLD